MHDRIAELAGLRAELTNCENGPRRESRRAVADDVRTQITRVRGELQGQAEELEGQAEELATDGQDMRAAEATIAARDIRTVLERDEAQPGTGPQENAAESKPRRTAAGGRKTS